MVLNRPMKTTTIQYAVWPRAALVNPTESENAPKLTAATPPALFLERYRWIIVCREITRSKK